MVEYFVYGIFGGLLAELLGLYKLRTEAPAAFPSYLRSKFYWLITCGMIFAGGALVLIYNKSGMALKPIVAVNIGASAPLIIGTLVQPTSLKID